MRRRLILLVAILAAGCAVALGGGGGPSAQEAAAPFQPCRPGMGGGGYHVRIFGISCAEVRRILPRMLGTEEPVVVRRGERVYVNDAGWTCHVQGLGALRASAVTCIRGRQLVVYRVA